MIGQQPSVAGLNASLTQNAVNMRNDLRQAINFFNYVNQLGVSGLEGVGFTATDAQNFFNTANYLNTVAQIFFGAATQATAFNFDNAVAPAYGGS